MAATEHAGASYPVRCSIGLAILAPNALDAEAFARPLTAAYFEQMIKALIGSADAALYDAKKDGRGQLRDGAQCDWRPVADAA